MRVVNDEIAFGDAIAELHGFDVAIGFAANAFVAVFAVDQRLAVLELKDLFAARIFFGERKPRAVVENVAILQNFNKGRASVSGGVPQRVFQVRLEDVHRTRYKRGFGTRSQRNRIERTVRGAVGSRLGNFMKLGSG